MLPLLSLATTIAGGLFKVGREMFKDSDKSDTDSSSSSSSKSNAVTNAQAASLTDEQRMAALAMHGHQAGSFALHYQSQLAKQVDTNSDGVISKSELQQAVTSGGGSSAQADTLYKAMDKNGDGTVSTDEFKSGIPVPKNAAAQQIIAAIHAAREAQAAKTAQGATAPGGTPAIGAAGSVSATGSAGAATPSHAATPLRQIQPLNAGSVLASLAAQLPAKV